ncbi:MAG: efflux RND transporter periplasmic adaptor subunit [Gemmatimonadota bacterium]|nr:efflux RND transporter periplasmic adaptor subunit [Gemmatimonadota bacterium]
MLIVLMLVGAAGYGIWWRLNPAEEEAEEETPERSAAADSVVQSVQEQFNTEVPVPVEGAETLHDTLRISVTAKGRAEPIREAQLKARASGVVARVYVQENQTVRAGQRLVQIDTTEYALELAAKKAALQQADAEYQVSVLGDDQLTDTVLRNQRAQLARAKVSLDAAEVAYQTALRNLEETTVRAPFEGRIADLKLVRGQYVAEGEEVATIVDMDPIKVSVAVLGTEVVYLAEGHAASVEFTPFPGRPFTGVIETINPIVDATTNTARVTVHIENPDGRIFPGMYAEADLEAQKFPDRIMVPRTAILEATDGRPYCFVVEDGRAKWHYVIPGMNNDLLVELLPSTEYPDRPEAGEIVLTDGHQFLIHDAAVNVVEDLAVAGGRPTR